MRSTPYAVWSAPRDQWGTRQPRTSPRTPGAGLRCRRATSSRCYPSEGEAVLRTHAAVFDVAVVDLSNASEEVVAAIVLAQRLNLVPCDLKWLYAVKWPPCWRSNDVHGH